MFNVLLSSTSRLNVMNCWEPTQKMVNACKMLATDVGAVKGKDKAEWTLYTAHTHTHQQAAAACAIW